MSNDQIRKKWEEFMEDYNDYLQDNITLWNNNLTNVKKYINENKKLPSQNDKNNEIKKLPSQNDKNNEIKKLGVWISNQKKIMTKKHI